VANTAESLDLVTQNSWPTYLPTCLVCWYIWQSDILRAKA